MKASDAKWLKDLEGENLDREREVEEARREPGA
jgi:hypothetical protein